jgi:hypothetical protein
MVPDAVLGCERDEREVDQDVSWRARGQRGS